MNNKIITRNKNNLPVIFCTTGNFLNLKKIKFIPTDKTLKPNTKKLTKKYSSSNLSQTFSKKEKSKDEIIKQLKDRINFLEYKIKILEKENDMNKKTRKNLFSKTLILSFNNSSKKIVHEKNKLTNIPLDKNLLKSKLTKRKKNIFELLDVNQIIKKKRNNSFNMNVTDLNSTKKKKGKNNSNITISNSISNYCTDNNSCTGSALKPKKRTINLKNAGNTINYMHNLLYSINSKTSKSKEKKKKNQSFGIGEKKNSSGPGRKINAIPKKGRSNASPKMLMSSTNYSNNISNSFKEDGKLKKNSPKKNNKNNNSVYLCEKSNNFNDIKNKLENIQIRIKNLLGFYSSINYPKIELNKFNNNNINKEMIKCANYSHYVKISKIDKLKKE